MATKNNKAVRISCVTTLYKSAEFLDEFVERVTSVLQKNASHYEIIIVDDGSPDNSLELAIKASETDSYIKVVELSRNFGHHNAILAGLSMAELDIVLFIDSDLEEAPELLAEFLAEMKAKDADVVYGYHSRESDSWFRRTSSGMFWRLLNWISVVDIPADLANIRIMRKQYVDALLAMPDRNVFLGGMFYWPGFKQVPILISREKRRVHSTYSFVRRLSLSMKAAISFSSKPLLGVFIFGMTVSIISFVIGMYFLLLKLLSPEASISGFTAVIVSIWFLGGMMIGTVGILGLYISQLFTEAKNRQRYIVRNIWKNGDSEA